MFQRSALGLYLWQNENGGPVRSSWLGKCLGTRGCRQSMVICVLFSTSNYHSFLLDKYILIESLHYIDTILNGERLNFSRL